MSSDSHKCDDVQFQISFFAQSKWFRTRYMYICMTIHSTQPRKWVSVVPKRLFILIWRSYFNIGSTLILCTSTCGTFSWNEFQRFYRYHQRYCHGCFMRWLCMYVFWMYLMIVYSVRNDWINRFIYDIVIIVRMCQAVLSCSMWLNEVWFTRLDIF